MTVTVVIPWRDGCPHREAALAWVRSRYASAHPDWDVVVAECPPGPWRKAAAVNPAVRVCRAATVVVADADVWSDDLTEAARAVGGGASWAVPHRRVRRLSADQTGHVLAGGDPARAGACDTGLSERPHPGAVGGGIVVLPAPVAGQVPLDPRFEGWGGEDHAWGYALTALAGQPWRGTGVLWHLWHPPQRRLTRSVGSRASEQLLKRYARAYRDPAQTRRLLAEGLASERRRSDDPPSGRHQVAGTARHR